MLMAPCQELDSVSGFKAFLCHFQATVTKSESFNVSVPQFPGLFHSFIRNLNENPGI